MASKKLVVTGTLLVAAVALIAATQVWLSIELSEGVSAQGTLTVTGQQLSPPLAPMALALAALALALTIAGRIFRFVLGALGVVLGGGIVALTLGVLQAPLDAAAGKVTELTGIGGSDATGIAVVASSQVSVWAAITATAGCIAALLGIAVLVWGSRWRAAGRKYETAATASGPRPAGDDPAGQAAQTPEHDRISDWDALSDGADPSEVADSGEPADPADAPEGDASATRA